MFFSLAVLGFAVLVPCSFPFFFLSFCCQPRWGSSKQNRSDLGFLLGICVFAFSGDFFI